MTPEHKLQNILNDYYNVVRMSSTEDEAKQALVDSILELKQWGRDMCDKQRYNCNENLEVETIDSHGQDTCYVNSDSVLNAPYPSELQD
jgi:hypothetical protein